MQYWIRFLFVQLAQSFVLLDVPPSLNSYYSSVKTNSSPLIEFMKTLYEQERVSPSTSDYNLIRALGPRLVQLDNVTMYVFDLNVIRRTETIASVSLHFYKRRTRWPISYALNEIYSSHRLSSLSAQIQLESEAFGWQSFPIGDVVQRQVNYLTSRQKSEYFGLTFKPTVTAKSQRRNIVDLDRFSVYTPFLIVYSNDFQQSNVFDEFIPKNFEEESRSYSQFENDVNRTNRSVTSEDEPAARLRRASEANLLSNNWTSETAEVETCAVKDLLIDFADLGFSSWLLEPKSYMANRCSGLCQTRLMTNHALVQHFLRRLGVRNDLALPDVGCVPARYSSLMVFYRSSDYHYLLRRVSNMIVDECHCR